MALRQPPGSATIASICSGMGVPPLMAPMLAGRKRLGSRAAIVFRGSASHGRFTALLMSSAMRASLPAVNSFSA
jgi:hypothetical protein